MTPLALRDAGPDAARALARQARVHHTPCGDGSMVWHDWSAQGPHDGPAVVLLHGGSGSWTHWLLNIASLRARGRRVLAADLPNFGDSAALPGKVDGDALPPVLRAGLAAILGDAPFDLVGFSFGGMVGGFMAQLGQPGLRNLVLVGAPALGLRPLREIRVLGWRHLHEPAQRDAAHRANLMQIMLRHPESLTEGVLRLHALNVERDRMPWRRLASTDVLRQALREVSLPVHAIYGEADHFMQGQVQALRDALAACPGFQGLEVIADAGHWAQMERAQAFDQTLARVIGA